MNDLNNKEKIFKIYEFKTNVTSKLQSNETMQFTWIQNCKLKRLKPKMHLRYILKIGRSKSLRIKKKTKNRFNAQKNRYQKSNIKPIKPKIIKIFNFIHRKKKR